MDFTSVFHGYLCKMFHFKPKLSCEWMCQHVHSQVCSTLCLFYFRVKAQLKNDTKVIEIHIEKDADVCTKCHGNSFIQNYKCEPGATRTEVMG